VSRFINLVAATIIGTTLASAQSSSIVPWQESQRRAYEPMPIICVHGICSDSRDCWLQSVNVLSNNLSNSYYHRGSVPGAQQMPGYSPSAAYVETFDYGTYQNQTIINTYGHLQTFDDVMGNAYSGVFPSALAVGTPKTLKDRINDVRNAYKPGNRPKPPVVLLAHSMGGLLAHYYLTQPEADGSVLRLATFGTPHYGSDRANLVRTVMGPVPSWMRRISAWG